MNKEEYGNTVQFIKDLPDKETAIKMLKNELTNVPLDQLKGHIELHEIEAEQ